MAKYVKKIRMNNNEDDDLIIVDSRLITIVDSGSTTAGTWIASTEAPTENLTEYVDGQLFLYKVAVAGANPTTLNIDGLGAKTIYRVGTTNLSTQYGVGQYLLLAYNSTNDCFRVVNDSDANSYAYARQYQHGANAAGTAGKYPLLARYNVTNKNGSYDTAYTRYHTGAYVDTSTGKLYSNNTEVSTVGHSHKVTVNGTTGANSGTAVKAVTAIGSNGTATALTGVKVTTQPTISLTANTATATGRITYTESVSGGSGSLTSNTTSTDGIKYVEAISGGSAVSPTTKYMKFNAGTTPKSGATPNTTSTNTGANSGDAITVVTGVASNGTATALTGVKASSTDTFVKGINVGSGSLDFYANSTTTTAESKTNNRIPFVTSISSTGASASGTAKAGSETHTHNYDKTTGVSLTANTSTATGRIKYVESISGGSGSLAAYDAATNGTVQVANGTRIPVVTSVTHTAASLGTASTGTVTISGGSYSGTTKYMKVSTTAADTGTVGISGGSGSLEAYDAATNGTKKVSNGTRIQYIHSLSKGGYTPAGSVSLTNGTAPSMGAATTKYLSASASGTAVGANGTGDCAPNNHTHTVTVSGTSGANSGTGVSAVNASVSGNILTLSAVTAAPNSHTHSYGSSTALTTSANSGTKVTALTGVKVTAQPTISLTANTATATGRITYVESQGTFTAGTTPKASASFTGTNSTAVVTGGTTYYLAHGHTAASLTGTKTFNTNGVKAVSLSASTTSTDGPAYTESISGSAPSLGGTKTFVTGYGSFSGGSITPTTYYLAHSHSGASATTKYLSAAPSNTSTASASPSATTSFVTGVSGGTTTATTKYLDHIHNTPSVSSSATAVTAVAANGTATVLTGVKASGTASVAPNEHTHTYDKTTSVTLTAGTAPSMNFNTGTNTDTPYISAVSGGSAVSATTKYLHHTHTAASATTKYLSASASGTAVGADGTATVLTGVKVTSTADVAPNNHTHTYGSSVDLDTH